MTNTNLVASFERLAQDGKGGDIIVKIYKMGEYDKRYAIVVYKDGDVTACHDNYISYGYAVKAAVEYIDNSEFYLS